MDVPIIYFDNTRRKFYIMINKKLLRRSNDSVYFKRKLDCFAELKRLGYVQFEQDKSAQNRF